jgi:uncharacterized protein YgfB (UPF0149 family)
MTKKEALELLQRVCAIYRGTLEEHQQLQTALQTIKEYITVAVLEEKKEVLEREEKKEDGTTKR